MLRGPRRRQVPGRLAIQFSFLTTVVLGALCWFGTVKQDVILTSEVVHGPSRHLLSINQTAADLLSSNVTEVAEAAEGSGVYPKDVFTMEQKRSGAVILHFLCLFYMFAGYALLCLFSTGRLLCKT